MTAPTPPSRQTVSVAAAVAQEAAERGPRRPFSVRYQRSARSLVVPLLLIVLVGALFQAKAREAADDLDAHGGFGRYEDGRLTFEEPVDRSAKRALADLDELADGRLPSSIAAGSVLACWRADGQIVTRAEEHQRLTGQPAATYADVGLATRAERAEYSPAAVAVTSFRKGCEFDVVQAMVDAANERYVQRRIDRWVPLMLLVALWLALIAWLARALLNLRSATGRTSGVGAAVLAWTPIWLVPALFVFGLVDLSNQLWALRGALVVTILGVAAYYARTAGRAAHEVWAGSGLPAPAFALIYWLPFVVSLEAVFLSTLVATWIDGFADDGLDVVSTALGVVGVLSAVVIPIGLGAYLVTVTAAQHLGIRRARRGLDEPPPPERVPVVRQVAPPVATIPPPQHR